MTLRKKKWKRKLQLRWRNDIDYTMSIRTYRDCHCSIGRYLSTTDIAMAVSMGSSRLIMQENGIVGCSERKIRNKFDILFFSQVGWSERKWGAISNSLLNFRNIFWFKGENIGGTTPSKECFHLMSLPKQAVS